jgi:hypothetical protein
MQHTLRRLGGAVLVLGATLAAPRPAPAFHTVFHFTVDRFEADGNVYGPAGGPADLVDEFDDGVLPPTFYAAYGTATESGGRLHLQNPGTHFPGPGGAPLDLSNVASYPVGGSYVRDGLGDLTGTAWWDPVVPGPRDFIHLTLFTWQTGGPTSYNELFGIDLQNQDLGLVVEQHLVHLDLAHGIYANVQVETLPIAPEDITGQIVFRIAFDDASNTMTSSFSLDGGTTFQSPFSPAPIFQDRDAAQFIIGADPLQDGPPPPTTTSTTSTSTTSTTSTSTTTTTLGPPACATTGCRESVVSGVARLLMDDPLGTVHDRLRWKWLRGQATAREDFGNPDLIGGDDLTFCAWDGAFRVLAQTTIPAGNYLGRRWWRSTSTGFRRRDRDGDRGGLKTIQLAAGAEGRAKVTVDGSGSRLRLLPPFPLTLPVTIQLRSETGVCWESRFEESGVVVNTPLRFDARSTVD